MGVVDVQFTAILRNQRIVTLSSEWFGWCYMIHLGSGLELGEEPAKSGGNFWPKVVHFASLKVPKNWINVLKWHIFGAGGTENFEKFRWFSKNSLTLAKIEHSITWKCIVMREMSKKVEKPLYIGYFSKFLKWHIFRIFQS